MIPLDARENACCVPLERAAGLLGRIGGFLALSRNRGLPHRRAADLVGPTKLICPIVLLSVATRQSQRVVTGRAERN